MAQVRLWVDPKFKKAIKVAAAEQEISILKLSKELGESNERFLENVKKKNKQHFKF